MDEPTRGQDAPVLNGVAAEDCPEESGVFSGFPDAAVATPVVVSDSMLLVPAAVLSRLPDVLGTVRFSAVNDEDFDIPATRPKTSK